ncbi:hypothetical protein [Thalassobaculum litoreum]|uniref:Ribbon-helix-helix protein, copG family n=1 Tax=Thalassobaculum litoreum DSM 18839 TaxID=1123362 RepID=A0A8G2BK06_9PROT|nr:hypothetical protein [Thalassobaculum litoreum]SDG14421.1 hypothetical protein SAMN05660686_03487 [Thalassobaculum litoreum DSM 18839]
MPASDQSGLRTVRLQIMLDRDELDSIDDWRYRHRMPSLAAAIRELIRRGMLMSETVLEDEIDLTDRVRSTDFRAI